MNRSLKQTLGALGLATVLVTPACGAVGEGGAGGDKVAFLMPDTSSTRYELHDRPGFEKRLKELCDDCEPLYSNADGDVEKQKQQFDSAVVQGAKVIVLDPVDSTAAASLVQSAKARGVKVIAYDRPIPDIQVDHYVSFDNVAIGEKIGASLVAKVQESNPPAGSGILIVNGSPTDAAAGLIKDGIHNAVDDSGLTVLAEYDTIEWRPENAQKWVAGQLSRFGNKVVGVIAANDGTAGGTIAAFKAAGIDPNPPVSGNDATLAGLQLVIAGDQYNTISKPSEIVGAAAAEIAVQFLDGETPEAPDSVFDSPTTLFEPTLITADNLKAEIVDEGITPAAQLCTKEYAKACARLGIK